MFAYGPADATASQNPHCLLPHLNPDWFYLCDIGLAMLSSKRGHLTQQSLELQTCVETSVQETGVQTDLLQTASRSTDVNSRHMHVAGTG